MEKDIQSENVHLKLDLVRHEILLDLGSSLVSLHQLLVVSSHDLQSHNLAHAASCYLVSNRYPQHQGYITSLRRELSWASCFFF